MFKLLLTTTLAVVIAGAVVAQIPPPLQPVMRPITLVAKPRVENVTVADGLRARNPANPQAAAINDGEIGGVVTLEVHHLPPGGSVVVVDTFFDPDARAQMEALRFDADVFCSAGLGGRAVPVADALRDSPDRHPVDASGIARIARRTGFQLLPGHVLARDFAGPCQGRIALDVYPLGGRVATRHYLKTTAFRLPNQRKRVRVSSTARLQSIFSFAMSGEGASVCSGGLPGLPVGMYALGGDLVLTVRSGPLGTVCRAASAGVALPDSVIITAIDWGVSKTAPAGQASKCCFGDECMTRVRDFVVFLPGHLPEDVPARYQGIGPDEVMRRLLRAPAPDLQRGEHQVGFAHAWMACDATALTDHSVSVTLKSVEFEVPHNYTL